MWYNLPKRGICFMNFVDYTGRRYGKLLVLKRGTRNEKRGLYSWVCKCDCGNVKEVIGADLRNGNTNSCGCMSSRNFAGERTKTHGMSSTKIYNVWCSMLRRCNNPNTKSYKDYGARGINVCAKWTTFEGFYEDMGTSYKEGLTIERIDPNGDYCKENCKWITKPEQALNKTNVMTVTYKGETGPLKTICRKHDLNYMAIYKRIKYRGWNVEKALHTPIQEK